MIFLCFMIPMLLTMLFYSLNKKEKLDKMTCSSFECGFESFFFSRLNISMQYFFFGLIFLLLDLELSIILPCFFSMNLMIMEKMMIVMVTILILTILMMELTNSMLEWKV